MLQQNKGMKSTKDVIALNVAGGLDIFDNVEIGRTILIDDGKLGLLLVKMLQLMNSELKFEMMVSSLNKRSLTSLTLKFLSALAEHPIMRTSVWFGTKV